MCAWLCTCAYEHPRSLLSALRGPCSCDAAAVAVLCNATQVVRSAPPRHFCESNILSGPAYVMSFKCN